MSSNKSHTTCVTVVTSRNFFPGPGRPGTNFDKVATISDKIATRTSPVAYGWAAGIQLQELTLGFWRFLLKSISGLAVVELPCWDAKFRQPRFVGDVVLLAAGYNLRNFFVCHHKKNVFRESNPDISGFNDGCHRRLTFNPNFPYDHKNKKFINVTFSLHLSLMYCHLC